MPRACGGATRTLINSLEPCSATLACFLGNTEVYTSELDNAHAMLHALRTHSPALAGFLRASVEAIDQCSSWPTRSAGAATRRAARRRVDARCPRLGWVVPARSWEPQRGGSGRCKLSPARACSAQNLIHDAGPDPLPLPFSCCDSQVVNARLGTISTPGRRRKVSSSGHRLS